MQFSDKFHNIHWKNLITAVAIPLAVGGLSAWITKDESASPDTAYVALPGGVEYPVRPYGNRLLPRCHAKRRGHESPHPVCCTAYL